MTNTTRTIDLVSIKQSIERIKQYVTGCNIEPLISVLEEFNHNADDKALLLKLRDVLNSMGVAQGAVLTYAPYILALSSDDPFQEKR